MNKFSNTGFSLLEVIISIALTGLSISLYLTFATQTNFASSQSKNYLQATSIMGNVYQDILASNSSRWEIDVPYDLNFDVVGVNPVANENIFFTLNITPKEYALLPGMKELFCTIGWVEDGKEKSIDYRVIK